jgi:hypothetical protein
VEHRRRSTRWLRRITAAAMPAVTEGRMLIQFSCERCGKDFQVDEGARGKRGRCLQCGHIMRLPSTLPVNSAGSEARTTPETEPATAQQEAPFRLSPPEPRPGVHSQAPVFQEFHEASVQRPAVSDSSVLAIPVPLPAKKTEVNEHHVRFELLDDDADPASLLPVSPEIARGLREVAEFEKDRRGYKVLSQRSGFFSRLEHSRPAGWFYVKWRAFISFILKVLRWIDSWAYLISVPFVMLMIFGIAVGNPVFVHTGAVVVVLANYGRFWADLLAFFVRPYKEGPLQGVAFLFPPYTLYYLTAHWDRMKPIVRRIATSCIPIVAVILAYAFLPSVNPAVKDVQGVAAKIRAGKEEMDREIDSDLREVESELRSIAEPKKAAMSPADDQAKP